MRPTARADELREPLRQALAALENAIIAGEVFDPSKANPTWTLGAADYGESTIVLPALRALRMAAPSARLSILKHHLRGLSTKWSRVNWTWRFIPLMR